MLREATHCGIATDAMGRVRILDITPFLDYIIYYNPKVSRPNMYTARQYCNSLVIAKFLKCLSRQQIVE
jgi:hypothetical protein